MPGEGATDNRKHKRGGIWYIAIALFALLTKYKTIVPLLAKVAVPVGSLLASVFAYAWLTRNWGIGIGIAAMIVIHEAGHMLAAKRKGLPVSLPLFIPFIGAFILLKKHPRDAQTEAYIALGGPVIGTAGALLAYVLGVAFESTTLLVTAYIGFLLNLFNLLPIHPLDGGRIAAAVTRWLWAGGLLAGAWLIWMIRSPLLFIVWAMFVWDLYKKYIKKGNNHFHLPFQMEIPVQYLRMQGAFIPGEEHKRELEFTTYSDLSGGEQRQLVEITWDSIGLKEVMTLQQQYEIRHVRITRIRHVPGGDVPVSSVIAHCEMTGELHEPDRYYEVSAAARWTYGAAYAGLAALLVVMMMSIHGMNIPGVRG